MIINLIASMMVAVHQEVLVRAFIKTKDEREREREREMRSKRGNEHKGQHAIIT